MSTHSTASSSAAPDLAEFARGFLGLAAPGPQPSPAPPPGGAAPHVYRQRIYHLIPYGHFDEVLALCEQLNALARARGGTGGSLWIPTVGEQNELIVEFEFDDLGVWQRGRAARNADPQWTAIVRKIGESVVPGSVRTELWETAPHLAT
ncbi:MAG TPA: NIPSNAP family protein [Gaiellaceae bacterium]|jgi:hypothetical protein|nr:NIPSNAP family protein [Gaiellaceae bacterium]